jgi:hypothetical protein
MTFLHSDSLKVIIGLVIGWMGIVIGWVLQETSHSLADRRERRRAISLALTDLMEIHLRFQGVDLILEKLTEAVGLPQHARAQLWASLEKLLPNPVDLHKRYDENVSVVASLDPRLGFYLRPKDSVRPLFSALNSLALQDAQAASLWLAVQRPLMQEALKALRRAIIELAKEYSGSTHRWAKKKMEDSAVVPKEVERWLEFMTQEVKQQSAARVQTDHTAQSASNTVSGL